MNANAAHRHGFDCPEALSHADTPIYDQTAWDNGFAPLPVVVVDRIAHIAVASPIAGI